MLRAAFTKLNSNRGVSRLTAILLVLVIVMSVAVTIPSVKYYQSRSAALGCAAGLDTARRRLAQDYLSGNYGQSNTDAVEVIAQAMNGWDDLCPSGGKVYLVKNEGKNVLEDELPYDLVCGMHDPDKKRCTRLNADYVLTQLREALLTARRNGTDYPETLTFYLNGKTRKARLTDAESGFKRGTSTTKGYEGKEVVVFYGIAGHSDFCAGSGAAEGTICYLSFADENHCALWRTDDGWTGDSYANR